MSFTLMNRVINPFVRALLRSPVHRLLSGRLLLITVIGRRTGKPHTLPVGYRLTPAGVTINVGAPGRKVWWRNLRSAAPVEVVIRGMHRPGVGRAIEADGAVSVAVDLDISSAGTATEGTAS